ncbi:Na+:solute symporter [Streptomyces sp. NPDC052236]|uniref:sodium:solute symporter family transporter n=1 Tax=Streptomyces sp. NPDC052236 TaxID=3365686 RepID=UPI0037D7EA2E
MTSTLAAPPLPPPPPLINTWAAPAIAIPLAIAITVVVFVLVNRTRAHIRNPTDFLLAGRGIGPVQNALAMVTGPIMYSTMFIITGHVALSGFDAVLLLTAFTMSMLFALLIYASPVRNVGAHTMGDLFALRARERPARIASAVLTLLIYAMLMIIMLDAVGMVSSRMLEIDSRTGEALVVGVVGLVAVVYVFMGGIAGVTRMLVVKAVLALAVVAVLTLLVLAKYNLNLLSLLDDAQANAAPDPRGYDLLGPGRLFGEGSDRWIHLSKVFSIVVGVAGIPYLFMRNAAVTSGRDARRSAGWAAMIIVGFYACISVIGLGAVAILGPKNIGVFPPHRDITLPKLADDLGGQWLAGTLGAIALLVVGAVFAALLINVVTSATKDINAVRGHRPDPAAELKDTRRNVAVIGIVSVVVGVAMLSELTHIFIPTSIDLGGAAVLPAVLYSLFWRRFNTAGLMWTVYGGIAVTMVMVLFSNGISGDPAALFPDADFKIFDIEPGLVSVPVAFLLGAIGTLTSSERNDAGFAQMQVRALTGAAVPAPQDPATTSADNRDRQSPTPSQAH